MQQPYSLHCPLKPARGRRRLITAIRMAKVSIMSNMPTNAQDSYHLSFLNRIQPSYGCTAPISLSAVIIQNGALATY
jgi:hypothetical protein